MADFRSQTQIWTSLVRLCIIILVLDFKTGFAAESTCKTTNYQSFLPPPYQNISSMLCRPVWNTYELRYTQNDAETTTIILSAPYTIGWVGIGLSKNGMMVGSSAMVGWINKHGHTKIKQFYLQGRKASEVIADKGEMPLNNVPAAVATDGAQIHLAFQLQITATKLGRQPVLLAFGGKTPQNHYLSKHVDKTALVFDFSSGSKALVSNNLSEMRRSHGVLGILGWGLILPFGAIVARYLRHNDPLWFYLHSVVQFVGFGFGLATVLLGLQLYSKMQAHIPAHRGIGIFVLVLSILQILAFFLRPSKESKIRRYWNWYHSWSGRLALFFAAVNTVLGMEAAGAGSDWRIGYGFLLGIVVVAVIVLEVLAYFKRSERRSLPPSIQMDPNGVASIPSNLPKGMPSLLGM